MVTVIVICCPHALGLAIPLVVAKSTALAARHGLLIRNRTAFENARKITTLVFDKTGTLTAGLFTVARYGALDKNFSDDDILRLAYSLEQSSEHLHRHRHCAESERNGADGGKGRRTQPAITGKGITATVNGQAISVVSPNALPSQPVEIRAGETLVYVQQNDAVIGYIALSDQLRPGIRGRGAHSPRTTYQNRAAHRRQ